MPQPHPHVTQVYCVCMLYHTLHTALQRQCQPHTMSCMSALLKLWPLMRTFSRQFPYRPLPNHPYYLMSQDSHIIDTVKSTGIHKDTHTYAIVRCSWPLFLPPSLQATPSFGRNSWNTALTAAGWVLLWLSESHYSPQSQCPLLHQESILL